MTYLMYRQNNNDVIVRLKPATITKNLPLNKLPEYCEELEAAISKAILDTNDKIVGVAKMI